MGTHYGSQGVPTTLFRVDDFGTRMSAAAQLTDPSDRGKAYAALLADVPALQAHLRAQRQAAYVAMHEAGMSWQDIADDQGVKRERAAQIGKGVSGGSKKRDEQDG
jgi:hypothetical protein